MLQPFRALLALAVSALSMMPAAHAQDPNAAYIVTYIEVMPAAAREALGLLRQFGKVSRNDPGNVRFEVLQRINPSNQFAILEVWKDPQALAAHAGAAHTVQFRERMQPLLRAPYDERPHTALSVGPIRAGEAGGVQGSATYAVTHVDIIPPQKDNGVAMVKDLTEVGRKEPGAIRFDSFQQGNRPNHMTIVEVWADPKSLDEHGAGAYMRAFRDKLLPMSGSLYDERFYKVVN